MLVLIAGLLVTLPNDGAWARDDLSALLKQAQDLSASGRYAEAEPIAKRLVEVVGKRSGEHSPIYASMINILADAYQGQGRYADAEPLYERVLAIREKALGRDHPDVVRTLNNLAILYRKLGRYADAAQLLERALAIREKALGRDDPNVAGPLINLANVYANQGRHADAVPLYERALPLIEKALGRNDPKVATALNNLAIAYKNLGRYADAAPLYERALTIREQALGPDHPDVAGTLNNLANVYAQQGRYADTVPLYERALAIYDKALGRDHPDLAPALNNLAVAYKNLGRYADAGPLYERALTIREQALGPDHPDVAGTLNNLANVYAQQGRYADTVPLFERALAIQNRALGRDHPDVGSTLNNLANVYADQGRSADAVPLYEQVLATEEEALGHDHPNVAATHNNLALIAESQSNWAEAVDHGRRSAAIIASRAISGVAGRPGAGQTGELAQRRRYFTGLIKAAHRLAAGDTTGLSREMFETAQWAMGSDVAQSLSQMAVRGAVDDPALAGLVRERQDLIAERQKRDETHVAAISQPPDKRNAAAEAENTARIANIDGRLSEINRRFAQDFPSYAALTSPAPASIADIQAVLAPDEALILILDTPEMNTLPGQTFIWAVTRDDLHWAKSDIGSEELSRKVATFRKPLDLWQKEVGGLDRPSSDGSSCALSDARGLARIENGATCKEGGAFSLKLAHELYELLLGPIADTIKDKANIIIVPSGPLTGLPFNALVTESPLADAGTATALKQAKWLIRKNAITVLPAVSSLKALRTLGKTSKAQKPFVGFGNPDFNGDVKGSNRGPEVTAASRGLSEYFRGGLADIEVLRSGLPALPDTADELRSIGKTLAASDGDIILGRKASETTVKSMSGSGALAGYKVVAFATHSLVAGEIKGLAEPAIALSVPTSATEVNDGLLTASETAGLKLDADWVILSACNTAAGGAPGAQALSGLSRAFFYAGARAILVSHWKVDSSAATKLTTGAFRALTENPGLGRAGALRQSMLNLIEKGAPYEAHPAYWAPFFIVGEGAAQQLN